MKLNSLVYTLTINYFFYLISNTKKLNVLGPVAPSWFSTELDQVGRRELVHDDCALHHF